MLVLLHPIFIRINNQTFVNMFFICSTVFGEHYIYFRHIFC